MAEEKKNLTEELIRQKAEEKAKREEEAHSAEKVAEARKKVMKPWVPIVAALVCFAVLLLIMGSFTIPKTVISVIVGVLVFFGLTKKRKGQIDKLPKAPITKSFAEEYAAKIHDTQVELMKKMPLINDEEVRNKVREMGRTLETIAEEVEKDPSEKNKVRKLANHYGDMILGLADKYIELQDKKDITVEGENVQTTLSKIQESFVSADDLLKKMLDSMFSDDAMEVSADVSTLESLMKMDAGEGQMAFKKLDE